MLEPLAPFIVLSLPRSRSAWLAHFLRYSGNVVAHDLAVECGSVEEFLQKLQLVDGTCETGAVLGWRLIRDRLPKAKLVVVKRDPMEVAHSLERAGAPVDLPELIRRRVMLDLLSEQPGVMYLDYPSLSEPETCKSVFEFCLDLPFDWAWWSYYHSLIVEVQMPARLHRLHTNHAKLEAFKLEVSQESAKLGGLRCLH